MCTIGNGDSMHEVCVSQVGYLAHGNRKSEARVRNRHKNNNSKRVVINMEERTMGNKGKSPKQGLTSAGDQTTELLEERESPSID